MLKHHICHVHCLDHPSVLKLVSYAIKYRDFFDGIKIATIVRVAPESDIYDHVYSILTKLGYEVITVQNTSMREVGHFFNISLPKLLSSTQKGVLYYNHSKGTSYHPDSEDGLATGLWTDVLYHYTLDNATKLPFENTKYKTFGSCIIKKKNFLKPFKLEEEYSYLGTFFWIKVESLLNKQFTPSLSIFYLEALPGLVSTTTQAYNLGPVFYELESPYKLESWKKKGIELGFPNKSNVN
jgi:hypothetical protein